MLGRRATQIASQVAVLKTAPCQTSLDIYIAYAESHCLQKPDLVCAVTVTECARPAQPSIHVTIMQS